MTQIRSVLTRANYLAAAGILVFASVLAVIPAVQANAQVLTDRRLKVSSTNPSDRLERPDGGTYDNLPPGDPRNGEQVSHEYTFTPTTEGEIEGFTIEYCATAFGYVGDGACEDILTDGTNGGFSADAWDGAVVNITRSGGSTPDADYDVTANEDNFLTFTLAEEEDALEITAPGQVITINMEATANNYFVNPVDNYRNALEGLTPTNGTYFAHISTYADAEDAETAIGEEGENVVDAGTVTNNVTQSISIYTRVQETLNFSVEGESEYDDQENEYGPSPGAYSGGPCVPLDPTADDSSSTLLRMGDSNHALDSQLEYTIDSYFRLATNSANGVNVYYSGDTLSSNNWSIDPAEGTGSTVGEEQFGFSFRNPLNPDSHHDFNDMDENTGYFGASSINFDVNSVGDPVSIASAPGAVTCDTGHVRYVANIAEDTPAGIYTTKINFIAAPRY